MLMYGNSFNLKILRSATLILGITSFREDISKINYLLPPREIPLLADKEFDIAYANYIINNQNAFIEFFNIINCLYNGQDVYLVISDDNDWSENLIESLLKFIQQRYGINAFKIDSEDDYKFAIQSNNQLFNPNYGLYNLDIDKERYAYIMQSIKIGSTYQGIDWDDIYE